MTRATGPASQPAPQLDAGSQPEVEDFTEQLMPGLEPLSEDDDDDEDDEDEPPQPARRSAGRGQARRGAVAEPRRGAVAEPLPPPNLNDPEVDLVKSTPDTADLLYFYRVNTVTNKRYCTVCKYVIMFLLFEC